jgi:hypothetical protein
MYTNLKSLILFIVFISITSPILAAGFITPSSDIVKIADSLSYKDFPRTSDILTIIRIESGFNPLAVNSVSHGIMQVNYAPFDIEENMRQGVFILRQYYLITKSIEGAVKSYNIGIGNYLKGLLPLASADYWGKFKDHIKSYQDYTFNFQNYILIPLECLGCSNTLGLLTRKSKDNCYKLMEIY